MMYQDPETIRRHTVAARDIRPLATLADNSGAILRRTLGDLGLPLDLLVEGGTDVLDLADYFRILERLSLEIQDETCHLSSRPLIPGSTHFVWSGVAGAGCLEEAMKRVAQAYNMLHGGHYNHVERREDAVIYTIDDRRFPYTARDNASYIHFTMECVLVFLHSTLMLVAGDELDRHLRKVRTRRPRPARHGGQLDFFAVPARYGAPAYALVYDLPAAAMQVRVTAADLPAPDAVYRKIVALIGDREAEGDHRGVAVQVADLLDGHRVDQPAAARALGMSVATLRRRLDAEGISFRTLRQLALDRAAKAMLRQGKHVDDVAETLGFADFRSFTRAFKNRNDKTPVAWLQAERQRA